MIKRILLLLVFACFASFYVLAQSTETPINPTLLAKSWQAKWIAPPDVSLKEYGIYHFRRNIDLPAQPQQFIVHVSADNRYQLYVNEKLVSLGPARGDIDHWRFETVDIAPFLQKGKNVLAAVVWNFGKHIPLAQMTYQTGFILQGNTEAEAQVNTNDQWKVIQNNAYTPIHWAPVTKFDDYWYFVVGASDQVDASKYPWGWEKADFNDSGWKKPVILASGKTAGVPGDVHWNMVPRNIPMLESEWQQFKAIRRTEGIKVDPNFLAGKADLVIPANSKVSVLVDQQVLTTAYPQVVVSGGKGSEVKITYAEALFAEDNEKKNRNKVEGMKMIGYYDLYFPDGSSRRAFMPLWYRTFRYVQLDIQTGAEPLKIHQCNSRFTAYPFEENGKFASGEAILKDIWQVAWRTARLCANETYMDCPYYEQLQYIGDTRIQALVSLYVSGDDRLMRNAIMQFNNSRIPEGITQSRYPSELVQISPTFSLDWILMVHDYWMYRNDDAFVKQFMPGIRSVLDWFETQVNEKNLVNYLPYYDFIDSAYPRNKIGEETGYKGMTVNTLIYVYALDHAVPLLEKFGKPGEADYYKALSQKIKKAVTEHCYDSNKKLFSDTPNKKYYSQHANVMAVLTDIVPADQQAHFIERVVKDTSLIPSQTYFQFYNAEAMRKAGQGDLYLQSLQSWKNMVNNGLTTFSEWEVEPRSDCHAWSASPNYFFLSLVTGVQPASPGFKTVRIRPNLSNLTWVEGQIPHPLGDIKVKLKRKGKKGVEGEVTLPEGLTGEFVWEGKTMPLKGGAQKVSVK